MKAIQNEKFSCDSNSSDQSKDEISNVCLMVIKDEDNNDHEVKYTYKKLYDAFQDLHYELKSMMTRNSLLKKKKIILGSLIMFKIFKLKIMRLNLKIKT